MAVCVALVWIWAAFHPRYPRDWLLENLLVFLWGGIIVATYRRLPLTSLAYTLLGLFFALHLVGSHYTYSEVPLGAWAKLAFGLSRNPYDRAIHFCYGLLTLQAFREILCVGAGVSRSWASPLAVTCVLAFSGFFEALEAVVAMIVSPELGAAYLGAQGDPWDAQKDTLSALTGALLAAGIIALGHRPTVSHRGDP